MEENIKFEKHIVKCPSDYSVCTGCESCAMTCSLVHDGYVSPSNYRIFVQQGSLKQMVYDVLMCQQCEDHPCYFACPKKDDAMRVDENNIVYIVKDSCIGCGACQRACRFTPPRISISKSKNKDERKAAKCDLCRDRAEGPICIQQCFAKCLALSDNQHWLTDTEEVVHGVSPADALMNQLLKDKQEVK